MDFLFIPPGPPCALGLAHIEKVPQYQCVIAAMREKEKGKGQQGKINVTRSLDV